VRLSASVPSLIVKLQQVQIEMTASLNTLLVLLGRASSVSSSSSRQEAQTSRSFHISSNHKQNQDPLVLPLSSIKTQ
jgi:hypothetical protein